MRDGASDSHPRAAQSHLADCDRPHREREAAAQACGERFVGISISMLSSGQIRAAQVLLHWSQHDLAEMAGIGIATVRRIEAGQGMVSGNEATLFRIEQAFAEAGLRYLVADEHGGTGVRLERKR